MSEILIGGNRIHYIKSDNIDGSRPTVLLIHGAGQSVATWKYQLDLLKNHPDFNLVVPDLPGHGESEGDGSRSIGEYEEFIKQFVDTLGLDGLILVGHSMGGCAAMQFAVDHSEKLRACVLVCTGARLRVAGETLKAVKNNYRSFCDVAPERAFAEGSPDDLRKEFREGLLQTSPEVTYWDLVACDEFDITDRLREIKVPCVIISGGEDILTPLKLGEYLSSRIKGSAFHVIKKAGHFVMQEAPSEFNRILLDCLSENG